MDPATASIVAGAASSGASGLSGIISQILANRQANKNIAAQAAYDRSLAEYQFDRNYQMWQEQNAYNTPASQVERLKAAGLNPHLAYGHLSSGAATSAPSFDQRNNVHYSQRPGYSIPDFIGMYQNFRQNDLTAANTAARTKNIQEQSASEIVRRGLLSTQQQQYILDNAFKKATLNTRIDMEKLGYSEKQIQVALGRQRIAHLKAQTDLLAYNLDFAKASRDLNMQILNEQILSSRASRALTGQQVISAQGDNRYLGNYLSDYDQFMYQRGLSNVGKNPIGALGVTTGAAINNASKSFRKWLKNTLHW